MQQRAWLVVLVVVLLLGLCTFALLIGAGGAWLIARQVRLAQTQAFSTLLPPSTPSPAAEEETPTPTLPAPTLTTTPTPPPTPFVTEPPPNVDFNGIRFYLDVQLAQGVLPELVAASPGDAEEAYPGSVYPEFTRFTFQGYILRNTTQTPSLSVYPLPEYRSMDRLVDEVADSLLRLLQARPLKAEDLPYLPPPPAAQLIQSNLRYVEFKNGDGLRYLTQFAQGFWPINNQDLFYTYQGVTRDQNWYVVAILPVAHPSLPPNVGSEELNLADPAGYYAEIEAQLSALPDDSFVPSLDLLDSLIASLRIR